MRYGTLHEPDAISWYEAETGRIVCPVGFVAHPHHDFLGVSPDGYADQLGRVEAKCPASRIAHHYIPEHYMPQCVGVVHITGGEWLDFISWSPDESKVHRITADETREKWKQWEAQLVAFWNDYVLADVQPPRKGKKNGV
jgi:hypothetical protein